MNRRLGNEAKMREAVQISSANLAKSVQRLHRNHVENLESISYIGAEPGVFKSDQLT